MAYRFFHVLSFIFLTIFFNLDVEAASNFPIRSTSSLKASSKSGIKSSFSDNKRKMQKSHIKPKKKNIKRSTKQATKHKKKLRVGNYAYKKTKSKKKRKKKINKKRSKKKTNKKRSKKRNVVLPHTIPALRKALVRQRKLFRKSSKAKKRQIKKIMSAMESRLRMLEQHEARMRQNALIEQEKLRLAQLKREAVIDDGEDIHPVLKETIQKSWEKIIKERKIRKVYYVEHANEDPLYFAQISTSGYGNNCGLYSIGAIEQASSTHPKPREFYEKKENEIGKKLRNPIFNLLIEEGMKDTDKGKRIRKAVALEILSNISDGRKFISVGLETDNDFWTKYVNEVERKELVNQFSTPQNFREFITKKYMNISNMLDCATEESAYTAIVNFLMNSSMKIWNVNTFNYADRIVEGPLVKNNQVSTFSHPRPERNLNIFYGNDHFETLIPITKESYEELRKLSGTKKTQEKAGELKLIEKSIIKTIKEAKLNDGQTLEQNDEMIIFKSNNGEIFQYQNEKLVKKTDEDLRRAIYQIEGINLEDEDTQPVPIRDSLSLEFNKEKILERLNINEDRVLEINGTSVKLKDIDSIKIEIKEISQVKWESFTVQGAYTVNNLIEKIGDKRKVILNEY